MPLFIIPHGAKLQRMIDLRKVGEEEALRLISLKASFPDVFDDVLQSFYRNRGGLSTTELCDALNVEYERVYRLLARLVSMGVLAKSEGKFLLTQKGIDLYKAFSSKELDVRHARALQRRHAFQVLKLTAERRRSWKEIYRAVRVGQSSIKNAIDALLSANLIKKDGGYVATDDGKELLLFVKKVGGTRYTPGFEVQAKLIVKDVSRVYESIGGVAEADVVQTDYYIFKDRGEYLRYRQETPLEPSLKSAPSHTLTWIKLIGKRKHGGVWIIEREREELKVEYPSIVFFLEFLGVKIEQKIKKQRRRVELPEVVVNLDMIQEPKVSTPFLEIKAEAWDLEEGRAKAETISEMIRGLDGVKYLDKTYHELLMHIRG